MEMVAAIKMRRAQERMAASRPYAEHMRKVIGHVAQGNSRDTTPLFREREMKRVGYIVVSTDRGPLWWFERQFFKKLSDENGKNRVHEVDFALLVPTSAVF